MKKSYYIYNGGQLKRNDNTIQYINVDGQKQNLPVETISDLYIMSEMSINTALLNILSKYGITVHFFNYYDFYIGSYYPKESLLSGDLIVKQVQIYSDNDRRLDLSKRILKSASANIYRNLRYYNGRNKDVSEPMERIEILRNSMDKATTIQELMGYEGNIRKAYYSGWEIIINQDLEFKKRVMNPPDNEINTLISYVNSLIYSVVLSQIYQTQLNPTISFLHEPGVRRFSLCLDIAEIFKPLIGDRLIFSLLNRNQINEKSFTKGLNGMHLTKTASQTVMAELDSVLKRTIKHKDLGKEVSYRYLIRLEMYKLIKHIIGEKEFEGFEIWW